MATSINEVRLKIRNLNKLEISDEFHQKINKKYNCGFRISISKTGYVLFGNTQKKFMKEEFRTETRIENIAKVLLEICKEYNVTFAGTFNYTTYCGDNGNVTGTFFIDDNKVIYYEFKLDELDESICSTQFMFDYTPYTKIITL